MRKLAETATSLTVTLPDRTGRKKTENVGALVLMAFVGPRPAGQETSHRNGSFYDNQVENLLWETRRENMARKVEHGTNIAHRGSAHPGAKLDEAKVRDIRARLAAGAKSVDLAREYGVAKSLIWAIKSRRAWPGV